MLLQSFTSEAAVTVSAGGVVVLNFDDLPPVSRYGYLPSGYGGLDWDCYYEGDPIHWGWKSESLDPTYSQPHSGDNYLFNGFGVKQLGFSLPNPDDRLVGAWFAKTATTTPSAVRFNGYNASHALIQQSAWLTLSPTPQYLAANFDPVARIEVEHSSSGPAWYTMDDLTYQTKPACTPPAEPVDPDPCDGEKDVPIDTLLSWDIACSPDCQMLNGGFESGNFAPWTTVTTNPGKQQLLPWAVATGSGSGWFGNGMPSEGTHFAQNGFDGGAGLYYDIYQEVAIPVCAASAILKWSERIQWDMVPYGATQPRLYVVSLQPAGGGASLAVLYTMNLNPGTRGDTGYVLHSVDLLSAAPGISGQTVRINFHEYIPQTSTGPAQFDLDGISLTCSRKSKTVITAANVLKAEYARIRGDTPAALPQETDSYSFDNNTGNIEGDTQIPTVISYTAGVLSTPGQIVNGDFETGNFSGWTLANSGNGTFVINNGTYIPPGPGIPLPPYSGNFSALSTQSGAGVHTIYQDVTLPAGATSATLRWADMILNSAKSFSDPQQEFRVEIRDTNNQVLSTLFSTNPGDPLTSGWTERSAGISQFAGMTIRVAFTEEDHMGYFNVHLDNIRIESGGEPEPPGCPTVYDVYFGTDPNALELIWEDVNEPSCDPTPDPNETLKAATTYYWQVVAKNCCGQTEGNIWSFTTAGHPPDCSGAVASVSKVWPPNHKWVDIQILGVVDPDGDPVTITITGITQDEPVTSQGSGNTVPDGDGIGTSVARVRAERSGLGNGRVYKISFDADDGKGGVCSGSVNVCVPHDAGNGHECADDGQLYDSTATELLIADLNRDGVINQLDFAIFASYWLQTYELDK
jgi:hypothetical protein